MVINTINEKSLDAEILDVLNQLKASNEAPDWMTSNGLKTLVGGYLLDGETPKDMYRRVSKAAAKRLNRADLEARFFHIMWNGYLGLSTPVAANMGAERGLPISCFSSFVPDSIHGIFDTIKEVACMSSKGGGTSMYWGGVRPEHSPITGGGTTNGVVPWLNVVNDTINSVTQGLVRRGALASYIDIEHGDFLAVLKTLKPTDFNYCPNLQLGVCVSDKFMQRLKDKDPDAVLRWKELLTARWNFGKCYILFIDTVNRDRPECYKHYSLTVKQSNLCCLEGHAMVVTKEGPKMIKELLNKTVDIWDGNEWAAVDNFESKGFTDELVKITFTDGRLLRVTPNHRVPLVDGICFAKDLKAGDVVQSHDLGIFVATSKQIENVEAINVEPTEVYCCTVPTTGLFALADGTMTGNSEIALTTDEDHSLVCCLSSLNVALYDSWPEDLVELSIYFLDAVMEEFLVKSKDMPGFERAWRSAVKGRALGLGVIGYHSYLQDHLIAYESEQASQFNVDLFKGIRQQADDATAKLAAEYGEPEWCKGFNRRNTHVLACAPTVSNSLICGEVSPGIDPITSAVFVKDRGDKGELVRYNLSLKKYLASIGRDTPQTWKEIRDAAEGEDCSVQHLTWMPQEVKDVFKTAREISQLAVVNAAAERQPYLDQTQSVNLFFKKDVDQRFFQKVHIEAYKLGVHSLYYCRSERENRMDKSPEVATVGCALPTAPPVEDDGICIPCQG
jgi:ribonucleotide reductase alpha subunit